MMDAIPDGNFALILVCAHYTMWPVRSGAVRNTRNSWRPSISIPHGRLTSYSPKKLQNFLSKKSVYKIFCLVSAVKEEKGKENSYQQNSYGKSHH